ncbi:MAG: Gfo/Idh/MocA family protein [Anaerolineae bacterium]
MAKTVKVALVGCGGISKAHVGGYQALFENGCREFEVTACVDVNGDVAEERAQEIAEFQGSKPAVLTKVEELIEEGVAEAADVCVPHCFHHTVGIPLLAGGLHVMIEKPVGITIRASKQLIAAAQQADRILATGEQVRRGLPARACAWAIKEQGLIGDVRLVVVQAVNHGPFDYSKYAMKWRGLKLLTGGGMIMDSGAHFGDMIQVLFGAPTEVWCDMASYDERIIEDAPLIGSAPADVEDTWHAVLRFEGGLPVTWTYSRSLYGEPVRQATYYGSAGTLYDLGFPFHPFQGGGDAVLADGSKVTSDEIQKAYLATLTDDQKDRLFPYGVTDDFAIEVWDFVNAIAEGRAPEMDGTAGLRAKALCEACYESATLGESVAYEDVLSGDIDAYQRPIDAFWELA